MPHSGQGRPPHGAVAPATDVPGTLSNRPPDGNLLMTPGGATLRSVK
ncbi:Uncharacterised protein [Mycobacteroides abscessus subsp. abscessus]|nr:Uncharacterised protein [Mycobacteroides abscessus subsp. abscessus]